MSALDELIALERDGAKPSIEVRKRNHEGLRQRLVERSISGTDPGLQGLGRRLGRGPTLALLAGVVGLVGMAGLRVIQSSPEPTEPKAFRPALENKGSSIERSMTNAALESPPGGSWPQPVAGSNDEDSDSSRPAPSRPRRAQRQLKSVRTPKPSHALPKPSATMDNVQLPVGPPPMPRSEHSPPLPVASAAPERGPVVAKAGKDERPLPEPGFSAELKLLQPAERALNEGKYRLARRLLLRHRRKFPEGVFRGEREALLTIIACRSASNRQRRAGLGRRFVRRYPGNPASNRVRSECSRR